MSQENVELTYQMHDAFNRRDLDAFLARTDPNVEFTPYGRAVEGRGPYRGHAGVREWWRNGFDVFPDLTVEVHAVRGFAARVFVRGRLHGHGAGSDAAFERALWEAVEWRDAKCTWWYAFASEAEALEAAGLSE
ncbi:MAG: nuclear transport factor 2 family protein [Solirubrobacterales bacterium]